MSLKIRVLVIDSQKTERGKVSSCNFHLDGVQAYFHDSEYGYILPGPDPVNLPKSFDLLILHNYDSGLLEELSIVAPLIVRYTGGDPLPSVPEEGFWFMQRSVNENYPISKHEANELLSWSLAVKEGDDDVHPPPILMRPPYPESLVAAYLLLIAETQGQLRIYDLDDTELWSMAAKEFNLLNKEKNLLGNTSIIPLKEWTHPSEEDSREAVEIIRKLFESGVQGMSVYQKS